MKNWICLIIILFSFFNTAFTQTKFQDWGIKYGIKTDFLLPQNEFANFGFSGNDDLTFDWYKFSYLLQGFFGFELSKTVEIRLSAGFGSYSGEAYTDDKNISFGSYETSILPIDLKLRVSPISHSAWNPYFYFGVGMMSYNVRTKPIVETRITPEYKGWVGFYPFGIGAEFALSEKLLLDVSLGGAISSSVEIDGYYPETSNLWDGYFNIGIGLSIIGETCNSDRDNDGLRKCDEEIYGTDPRNPDSDGDGIKDGDEIFIYKTDPLKTDTDGDGISDYDEIFIYKTNPLSEDTDGDGLEDGVEILLYKTNPLISDTDGDGLYDGDEILKYKTDPLNSDTDGDGLSDGDETLIYKTDPLKPDTDGDGLNDGEEILTYKTNPLLVDSDGDGLTDYEEIFMHRTDPINPDTDGGSVDDGTEIMRGTNPFNPKDDIEQVQIGVPIVLDGITFAKNRYNITPESESNLIMAFVTLINNPDIVVEISGHTDNVGRRSDNMLLSQRRADAVKGWLVTRGIDASRIVAIGYGPDRPSVPNDTQENRQKNRRIEFVRVR